MDRGRYEERLEAHIRVRVAALRLASFTTSFPAAINANMERAFRERTPMTIRIAAIGVSHWHALNDAAYLRHLLAMPDVELAALQDSDAGLVARRAAEVGNPPTFTDYSKMLAAVRPDFVVALGRHRQMAAIAHDLLDAGYPFLMEKPMGINAAEVNAVAVKAARLNAFVAVPLAQRYAPFAKRARELIDAGRFGPLSHIYVRINRPGPARYPAWDCAWMLDPAEAGGGALRNLGPHGLDMFLHLTGEEARVTGAQLSRRAHEQSVEDYASVMLRSASGVLGTVEVGNDFPRDGTDGEWKIAGRDGILTMKDGILKLATAAGDDIFPGTELTAPYFTAVRDALDHWQRGAPPPISVHDCARTVRLIDQAYARAAPP
jgi:predicted dehydrogenase